MQVHFWGVRGSIAVSGPDFQRTGGSTACLELRCGDPDAAAAGTPGSRDQGHRIVLDAGTGLRALGDHLGYRPVELTIVFSHVHWDHIQGFPFFQPAFHPDSRLTLVGARRPAGGVAEALRAQMQPPRFPVTLDRIPARLEFRDLAPGEVLRDGPFEVRAAELSHPDGVLGIRVTAGGRSVVYATDHEHGASADRRDGLHRPLVALARDVDLLVHDAQYTPAEYAGEGGPPRKGWGHSTWQEAVAAARAAGAGRLALFHHDPRRSDDQVAVIEAQARHELPGAFAAREGLPVAV
ncbi:MAG: MBL fold metallo-hydrolase [Alphaproteobacteria bacterium]|nr:MBL fold metallo-hydrolase [Alphaproteobacteria bacterium]